MGVGFCGADPNMDMGPWSKDVMRISKMGFVMQMVKKVFSVEIGFGMVVTKKGFEVMHFLGVSDRSILGKI